MPCWYFLDSLKAHIIYSQLSSLYKTEYASIGTAWALLYNGKWWQKSAIVSKSPEDKLLISWISTGALTRDSWLPKQKKRRATCNSVSAVCESNMPLGKAVIWLLAMDLYLLTDAIDSEYWNQVLHLVELYTSPFPPSWTEYSMIFLSSFHTLSISLDHSSCECLASWCHFNLIFSILPIQGEPTIFSTHCFTYSTWSAVSLSKIPKGRLSSLFLSITLLENTRVVDEQNKTKKNSRCWDASATYYILLFFLHVGEQINSTLFDHDLVQLAIFIRG